MTATSCPGGVATEIHIGRTSRPDVSGIGLANVCSCGILLCEGMAAAMDLRVSDNCSETLGILSDHFIIQAANGCDLKVTGLIAQINQVAGFCSGGVLSFLGKQNSVVNGEVPAGWGYLQPQAGLASASLDVFADGH